MAVYGNGSDFTTDPPNPFGVVMPAGYKYGKVYNIWEGGSAFVSVNDIIMFREQDVEGRVTIATNNHSYTLVPARLATKQSAGV